MFSIVRIVISVSNVKVNVNVIWDCMIWKRCVLIMWWKDTSRKIKCLTPYYPHSNLPTPGEKKIRNEFLRMILVGCVICDYYPISISQIVWIWELCELLKYFCKIKCRSRSDTLLSITIFTDWKPLPSFSKEKDKDNCNEKGKVKDKDNGKEKYY